MRLLHTKTLELKEFFGKDIPLYVILSHTWEEGQEVTFHEFQNPNEEVKQRSGYKKILDSCFLSDKYGFHYIWIDTCCINKDSSAELSEAINSMYEYYRNSTVCYAYLEDVCGEQDPRKEGSQFRKSKWFTRGWTLQELMAPSRLVFFSEGWVDIGTKSSLKDIIIAVTGIPSSVLSSLYDLQNISVAQKMSWAARRETTREEDLAYCLMGIVGVNMPTLYGEGGVNAFMRLQEEIIKRSADQSIFAWKANRDDGTKRGLLARSPSEFVDSWRVRDGRDIATYSTTNRGLCIKLPL
ncbi:HET-domain-containing protein, partial [Dendrothele bispora CBS 962.96]